MTQAVQDAAPWPTPWRAWSTVIVLMLAYTVSFVDRTIISLLVEPIKADLHLTDTQLSLLQGLAFSLFYTTMGLPFGWLIDRVSRKWVIVFGATVWCVSTAACGLAGHFWHLFLGRIGVGAGEACLSPAAVSMIGDNFPPEKRSLPLGFYVGASSIGSGLALVCGGAVIHAVANNPSIALPLVGEVRSWQAAFLIVGLAGLVVVGLVALLREPIRRRPPGEASEPAHTVIRHFRRHPMFYVCQYLAVGLYCAMAYGLLAWIPAYFIRKFEWSAADTGLRYGLVLLIAGGVGSIAGGWIANRVRATGRRTANVDVAWPAMMMVAPLMVVAFTAPNAWMALGVLSVAVVIYTVPSGLAIGAIQDASPASLHGRTAAVYYLVIGLLGLTVGPLLVALLTDYVFQKPEDVGLSLAVIAAVLAPTSAVIMLLGRKAFDRALAEPNARQPA
ncbi:MAG: MFS transporter [Brevundimonas sp.]|nr:MAG: MFS transporter [Brevundimonas sp.]